MTPLALFSWKRSAQSGAPCPVRAAIWSRLGRSLEELPSILTNGVDHALTTALSRVLVRLRSMMASILSRPVGDRDANRPYHPSTAEMLRRHLTVEYGVAVADTNTVFAALPLWHLAGPAPPPLGAPRPETHQQIPCPSRPQYVAESSSTDQPTRGVVSGPFANAPSISRPGCYAPEEDLSQSYGSGNCARSGRW